MAASTLCVLLWAREGREQLLIEYEDQVLGLIADHGGEVLSRARSRAGRASTEGEPFEVHLIRFRSQQAFDSYMNDERRLALAQQRDRAIARTEVLPVDMV